MKVWYVRNLPITKAADEQAALDRVVGGHTFNTLGPFGPQETPCDWLLPSPPSTMMYRTSNQAKIKYYPFECVLAKKMRHAVVVETYPSSTKVANGQAF